MTVWCTVVDAELLFRWRALLGKHSVVLCAREEFKGKKSASDLPWVLGFGSLPLVCAGGCKYLEGFSSFDIACRRLLASYFISWAGDFRCLSGCLVCWGARGKHESIMNTHENSMHGKISDTFQYVAGAGLKREKCKKSSRCA